MNHLIVYAHPKEDSFNHAILESAVRAFEGRGDSVVVRNLYSLSFNPVLSASEYDGTLPPEIIQEQSYITNANAITLIFPLWWTSMPAILKGYIDRIFSYGFAYQFNQEGHTERLLQGKKGFMITTQGSENSYYDSTGMTEALKLTTDTGIYNYCGIESLGHLFLGNLPFLDNEARSDILKTVESKLKELF